MPDEPIAPTSAAEQAPTVGFRDDSTDAREQSLGERVMGSLLDRAHLLPPRLVGPLVAQELVAIDCRRVAIHLQDLDQQSLRPLRGEGLHAEVLPIDESAAGQAARADVEKLAAAETIRRLSHALMAARRGRTSDDASLLVVEWKQPPHDDELSPFIPEATPTDD